MDICLKTQDLTVHYGDKTAVKHISLEIPRKQVTAFIGPSGCGKTSLLRCFNRMNDVMPDAKIIGEIFLDGENIYDPSVNVNALRRRVGMVFQKPSPFPKTIFENVAFGLRLQGIKTYNELKDRVVAALKSAALWNEVHDRLDENALILSGGQQQRLVIARAIAIEPEVLLLDEPASALDPISTLKLEELIYELKSNYTIVIVTHNMQQAARVSDRTAFLYMGELIEYNDTKILFTRPVMKATEDYISGRYG